MNLKIRFPIFKLKIIGINVRTKISNKKNDKTFIMDNLSKKSFNLIMSLIFYFYSIDSSISLSINFIIFKFNIKNKREIKEANMEKKEKIKIKKLNKISILTERSSFRY